MAMRKVYLLPNLFTTASLFCGLLAILNVYNVANGGLDQSRYETSCWLILASAFLDMLDGWVARMTHSESLFGVEYDSLADLVAFGVAPAILIYTRLVEMQNRQAAEVITTIYVICGALRLARFNVQKAKTEKLSFTGLPIPAAAGTVVSSFLFFQQIDPDWNKEFVLKVLPVVIVVLAYLMVSNVSYFSLKQLRLERRKPFDWLKFVPILIAAGFLVKRYFAAVVFVGFTSYVVWGLVWEVVTMVRGRKTAQPHPGEGPAQ
jgi:CDP-diacylglycerol---serine O-phosphatidyltransferase